jgi:hypothetical protein
VEDRATRLRNNAEDLTSFDNPRVPFADPKRAFDEAYEKPGGDPFRREAPPVPKPKQQFERLPDGRRVFNILHPLSPWRGKGPDPYEGITQHPIPDGLYGSNFRKMPLKSETFGDEMQAIEAAFNFDPKLLDRMSFRDVAALNREVARLLGGPPSAGDGSLSSEPASDD